MATGLDELIDCLLSEIALCGTQGAGSADFRRFIRRFLPTQTAPAIGNGLIFGPSQEELDRAFYEKTWKWVASHPDIRILHANEVKQYSLAEFEVAEQQQALDLSATAADSEDQTLPSNVPSKVPPASSLLSLRAKLRKRLSDEGSVAKSADALPHHAPLSISSLPSENVSSRVQPRLRRPTEPGIVEQAVFDQPSGDTSMPRLYASQGRIWQALTGHSMDLKKVPTMEFVLLSIIAANGANGITQPILTQVSQQDKRSVPHRTDELARKGYIIKKPVQASKARTSLCIHVKFVSDDHFTSSGAKEDVFREDQFVASGFAMLLYETFKDAGVVPTRDIRTRMDVPMRTWNKRAVQGTLIRLDQSGMIKRFRVRKKKTEDSWVICFQVLREPRAEDIDNLGFRRQAAIADTNDELFADDDDGDTLMRDLEVDMLDDGDNDEKSRDLAEDVRIPPQWIPERLLSNTIFEFTALGRTAGWDAVVLRDRIVGPFWRRPTESYLTRLTDDWKKTQPPSLRHLAIIRDTRNTEEKKFIHYVYRTYGYFQDAVEAGEAIWEGVTRPAVKSTPKRPTDDALKVNVWGFYDFNQKDFVRFNGTASLSDVRSAIVSRRYGPRWDNALAQEIGYQKTLPAAAKPKKEKKPKKEAKVKNASTPKARMAAAAPAKEAIADNEAAEQSEAVQEVAQEEDGPQPEATSRPPEAEEPTTPAPGDEDTDDEDDEDESTPQSTPAPSSLNIGKAKKKGAGLTLTAEERVALGLKPTGRLTKSVAQQILAHREETGDPTSLPERVVEKPHVRNGHVPLMTKEERLAAGLSVKGRLGIRKENEIREQRGLPKLTKKGKKKSTKKETPILTRQQRIALGFIGHGRLHQHFVDALRKEQEDDVPLEESPAVEAYREFLKAEAAKEAKRQEKKVIGRHTPATEATPEAPFNGEQEEAVTSGVGVQPQNEVVTRSEGAEPLQPIVASSPRKRKADTPVKSPLASKKQRIASDLAPETSPTVQETIEHPSDPVTSAQSPNETIHEVASSITPRRTPQATRQHTKARTGDGIEKNHTPSSAQLEPVTVFEDKTLRLLPGVHLYPDAKRKLGRGRPRKAYIVAFRLARLSELPRFNSGEDSGYDTDKIVSLGSLKTLRGNTSEDTNEEPSTPNEVVSAAPLTPAANFDGSKTLHGLDQGMAMSDGPEALTGLQPAQDGASNAATTMRVEGDVAQASPTFTRPEYRPVAPSTLSNTSAQVTKPSYQSPYAPHMQSKPSVPGPRLDDIEFRKSATPPADESPGQKAGEMSSLPQGVVGPIAELQTAVSPKKRKGRGSVVPISGTQRLLRREIIMEIINRCGGAFPLQGEIWRPFQALWNQRHGTAMKMPDNSAVHGTLRNMIATPVFGLKKMIFCVQNRNATGSLERAIVTKVDMAPNHPTVKRLAFGVANHSHPKSQQFFPKEIRDLFEYISSYVPPTDAPRIEDYTLEDLYPKSKQSKESKEKRRKEKADQKRREKEAARELSGQVKRVMLNRGRQTQSRPAALLTQDALREKRTRLASLNDKAKQYRRGPTQVPTTDVIEESEDSEAQRRVSSPARSDSSEDVPLMLLRPLVRDGVETDEVDDDEIMSSEAENETKDEAEVEEVRAVPALKVATKDPFRTLKAVSFTRPVVCLHTSSGTFSTSFNIDSTSLKALHAAQAKTARKPRANKRARIDSSTIHRPTKKARNSKSKRKQDILDDEFVYSSVEDSDGTSSEDEEEEEDEDDDEEGRPKKKSKKRRTFRGRQLGKKQPMPTLLERLTGLTGDPNDPIYTDPAQRDDRGRQRPWVLRKKRQLNELRKEREYAEAMDRTDEFKKLCFTLVIASSMSGVEDTVDWSIVEKIYARDKFFDMLKVKKLWAWMQEHMAVEVAGLTESIQASIITAYEAGKLPEIDEPGSYDWTGLLRWTMRSCAYPALPLPLYREALAQFDVDESSHATLNRISWHGTKIADATRIHLQLQAAFVAPLHHNKPQGRKVDDKVLKARSWTRANIATPQVIYDANKAHEKLKPLGEDVLTKVVAEFVQNERLRLRKIKRQLPGRNYTFTKKFAKTYKRPFELEDFMVATTVKKALDLAFNDEDADKRFYSMSRCEEDGSIMAILSMAAAGQVKLVPQLPPVNNEFGAPLPRLSKWGFCEGDYIHRAIDRNRLFWDTHVVPTENYKFGSPLHSLTAPAADWPSLPEPPLPGKHDPNAILPIWSSIDGQTVTWPWWYRILNLVLQPLHIQPGATLMDVFSHCPDDTTELFEVELVLGWLESVGAVTKIIGGGYQAATGFWAAFGDRLRDTADDWFGAHVARKQKATTKQQWRDKYNQRYAAMQTRSKQSDEWNAQAMRKTRGKDGSLGERIGGNPLGQYRILAEDMLEPVAEDDEGDEVAAATDGQMLQHADVVEQDGMATANMEEDAMDVQQTPEVMDAPIQDQGVEMMDADDDGDVDAEGEEEDAEGEMDDEMY